MRNLVLFTNRTSKVKTENVYSIIIDPDKNYSYIVDDNHDVYCIDWLARNEDEKIKELFQLVVDSDDIASIEYLALNDEFCLATKSGEILLFNPQTKAQEVVTICDNGIESMLWSPDQEVAAIVTNNSSVIVMNTGYDFIMETSLRDSNFGNQEFINVGWGKKETQFHGSVGKQAAFHKSEETNQQLNDADNLNQNKSIITWRGDCEYFAVSFLGEMGRMFKVFDKEGKLQFTSEKCAGLEAVIAWRPSGLWIAIPQLLPDKYVIALFEKNGLRHREIILPFQKENETIKSLTWSSDSEVLAIETIKKKEQSCIYLYTICNYHWYLKQYLEFDAPINKVQWDNKLSERKSLHVLLADGMYHLYRWEYSVSHSWGHTQEDESIVSVIDGNNVLVTNFRATVIPPPMCGITLKCEHFINFAGFVKFPKMADDINRFYVVDKDNNLMIYNSEFTKNNSQLRRLQNVNLIGRYQFNCDDLESFPLFINHWLWLTDDIIIFNVSQGDRKSQLFLYSLITDEETNLIDKIEFNDYITNINASSAKNLIISSMSGCIFQIRIEDNKFQKIEKLFELPDVCEQIEVIEINGELKIFSLKNKQMLYINDEKFKEGVTSIFVTDTFLAYTTLDQLQFVTLDNRNIVTDRKMESGGRLVVVVAKDSRTVLQMPRGNLETVQPRALSLGIIAELLDNRKYEKAYDLFRKQRINLNLFVDHNPVNFLENIHHFLDEIKNPQWLNLFLSELQNEDVSMTIYASNYKTNTREYITNFDVSKKIDVICEELCEAMLRRKDQRFILPIITSYVKRNNLEKALEVIWQIKLSNHDGKPGFTTSEEALKYLLYMVDVNELYNVALGMYDFGLVLFVAKKSQKDPKEYIPFLNELRLLDENYRKFKIDFHLKRYEKALENIIKCGEEKFNECLELVQNQNLYTKAMRLIATDVGTIDERHKKIVLAYADHLREKGKLVDASLMYERAGDLTQAIMSAKNILDWQRCLTLKKQSGASEEELKTLAATLVPLLKEQGYFKEAAHLIKTYQQDYNQVIDTLLLAKLFPDALYEARTNCPELCQTVIKNYLWNYVGILTSLLNEDINNFKKYTTRLLTIRREKLEKKLNPQDNLDNFDDCDLYSDTTSVNSSQYTGSSRGTGKTFRSSKNRRKHERKLLNLKEGNPFEDIALIDVLYNLVHKSFNHQQHIKDVSKVLIELELDSIGVVLQNTYRCLLNIINESLDEIWIPEMITSEQFQMTPNFDYKQMQDGKHYSMIKPHQRFKPQLIILDWSYEILK